MLSRGKESRSVVLYDSWCQAVVANSTQFWPSRTLVWMNNFPDLNPKKQNVIHPF